MKKTNIICSAIAAFSMLALAGCDLVIPESQKCHYASADFEVETLPYVIGGTVLKDSVLEPLESAEKSDGDTWEVEDGVSLSFWLEGYTDDWSQIFQVQSANFGTTTMHQCAGKIWQHNSYGCSAGNGSWDQFLGVDCYLTISMDYNAGTMSFYKNGELVTVYGGDEAPYGAAAWEFSVTGKEWVQGIIQDICDDGIYCIHPSDSWAYGKNGDYKMKYFVVDEAVDADGAAAKYNDYLAFIGE